MFRLEKLYVEDGTFIRVRLVCLMKVMILESGSLVCVIFLSVLFIIQYLLT